MCARAEKQKVKSELSSMETININRDGEAPTETERLTENSTHTRAHINSMERLNVSKQSLKIQTEAEKVSVEKCWRCGRPCNPVLYVRSERSHKDLPLCQKCAQAWLNGGRMPK